MPFILGIVLFSCFGLDSKKGKILYALFVLFATGMVTIYFVKNIFVLFTLTLIVWLCCILLICIKITNLVSSQIWFMLWPLLPRQNDTTPSIKSYTHETLHNYRDWKPPSLAWMIWGPLAKQRGSKGWEWVFLGQLCPWHQQLLWVGGTCEWSPLRK